MTSPWWNRKSASPSPSDGADELGKASRLSLRHRRSELPVPKGLQTGTRLKRFLSSKALRQESPGVESDPSYNTNIPDPNENFASIPAVDGPSDSPNVMGPQPAVKGHELIARPRVDSSLPDYTFEKFPAEDTPKTDNASARPACAAMRPKVRDATPPGNSTIELVKHIGSRVLGVIDDGDSAVFAQRISTRKLVDRIPVRDAIAMGLGFQNSSQEYWWNGLTPIIENLMIKAQYPDYLKYAYLAFIAKFILPSLGSHSGKQPAPPKITHDRCTLEPSLNISKSGLSVRFTIEPRGPFAGLPQDPFGQHQGRKLFDEIFASSPLATTIDSTLFNHFANEFWVPPSAASTIDVPPERMPPQCQLAFDLHRTKPSIGVKAYFIPRMKSLLGSSTPQNIAFDAIARAPSADTLGPAFSILTAYMSSLPESRKCSVQMIAIDCTCPATARVKAYVKPGIGVAVSMTNICDMYTLGGRLCSKTTAEGLEVLRSILPLLLDAEDEDPDTLLTRPLLMHHHAGIVASYELMPGAPEPEVKFYVPVWAYVRNDRVVAENLTRIFRRFGWDTHAVRYALEFEAMFEGQLGKAGRHCYVSFAWTEARGAYVTVYYSPGVGVVE
ncbi:aromatic prenyltransferase [Mytilinidion resinicola]|uniref:Aromatic prenyltransferase n=1 Tax=Mytilinidion resinicola TaxID=574789 RepID=A0A6A6YAN0_9PEZI|nr:aromatic prenyltransferase [Mytilinidion resinicola]KAF2805760.1 aromatic prenyltransferase [Mytilinidion resinicola]